MAYTHSNYHAEENTAEHRKASSLEQVAEGVNDLQIEGTCEYTG
jgi:hypothetical protein